MPCSDGNWDYGRDTGHERALESQVTDLQRKLKDAAKNKAKLDDVTNFLCGVLTWIDSNPGLKKGTIKLIELGDGDLDGLNAWWLEHQKKDKLKDGPRKRPTKFDT